MADALDEGERARLAGEEGPGAALAMRLVLVAAEALGAERLIPITRAHVDSCLYHGQATLDFVQRLAEGGARVSVPTTLNVGTLDLLHPELWRGDPEHAERGRRLMEGYRALGCRPTFTCAPYQLADARPELGEQVAWAESNAIVFCNSVLGARTERYGDFTDIACAITGGVPDAGLHRTDARRAVLVLRPAADVSDALLDEDAFYPVLGIVLGQRAGSRVAALEGLPAGLSEDRLKAVGASAASSGAVAMFHAVGSTPEAPSLEAALEGGQPVETVEYSMDELRAARDALVSAAGALPGDPIGAVSLGTPHASLAELRSIAAELGAERAAPTVELLVSTSRDVLAEAERDGTAARLRDAGVELLVDTCSYLGPILRPTPLPVMTDSGKWAWYAPANIGARVVFASRRECLRSAVLGTLWRDESPWGGR
ncbi:MAG TPA: aconitase X catalytic domain-containing protein [Candidatus Limnocylindrales bacterium]|nr:aconitase X catalytic domain-containing protein [Candidatus Limnocylindrales bacterium]